MYANQFSICLPRLIAPLVWLGFICTSGCVSEFQTTQVYPGVVGGQNQPNMQDSTRFGPNWARGMVWYQVFPERFANGNPGNDPVQSRSTTVLWDQSFDEATIEEIERTWMLAQGQPRLFGYDPNRAGGSIANVIYQRRYGGDLQGVYNRLDELQSLGVEGIYLCPVFTSTSLHKYDAADHRHIDPTLGHPGDIHTNGVVDPRPDEDPSDESTWGWTPADRWFVDIFIPAVRERGMKVMLDGVLNHVGVEHWAFRDVRKRGRSSRYADWFEAEFDDNGELIGWESWNGRNGGLPVFRQLETGDLAPGPKAHMMAITRRWMDPNGDGDPSDGIDGWRLDVANEIGRPFWKDWRAQVKGVNPETLIVGEIWFDAAPYFDGTAFDAQMNYPVAYAVADWLSIGHMKGDASSLAARLNGVYSHHPETDACQLNLMSSHDTERLASLMQNDHLRSFDNGSHPWRDADTYDRVDVGGGALVRALVAYSVMVASPGSPMIYNGDEFGMVGADDPDDRRPIPVGYQDGTAIEERNRWFRDEVRWIMLLKQHPEYGEFLRTGEAQWGTSQDEQGLRVIRRLGSRALVVDIGPCGARWDQFGDGVEIADENRVFSIDQECWQIRLGVYEWPE